MKKDREKRTIIYKGEKLSSYCKRTGANYQLIYRTMFINKKVTPIEVALSDEITTPTPCKWCKCKDVLIIEVPDKINTLYYARCKNCNKWGLYEFVGISKTSAIKNWNEKNV